MIKHRVIGPGDAWLFQAPDPSSRLEELGWARVELDEHGDAWVAIHAYTERVGVGTALMDRVCEWADVRGFELRLKSKPHLVCWYAHYEFRLCDPPPHVTMAPGQVFMVRAARVVRTCGGCEYAVPHGMGSLQCVMREGCESGQCESNVSADDDACEQWSCVKG